MLRYIKFFREYKEASIALKIVQHCEANNSIFGLTKGVVAYINV